MSFFMHICNCFPLYSSLSPRTSCIYVVMHNTAIMYTPFIMDIIAIIHMNSTVVMHFTASMGTSPYHTTSLHAIDVIDSYALMHTTVNHAHPYSLSVHTTAVMHTIIDRHTAFPAFHLCRCSQNQHCIHCIINNRYLYIN
jgi:hypothetical protein